LGPMTNFWP